MSIVNFDYLQVTTMTMIFSIHGTVDLPLAFQLLNYTKINLPPPKRKTQKIKLPHYPVPGALLSLQYEGDVRGAVTKVSNEHFRNSITIVVSTSIKNVVIKLSKNKIQMCGAKSKDMGIEGYNHVINRLNDLQSNLNYFRANPEILAEMIDWITDNIKDVEVERLDTQESDYSMRVPPPPPPTFDLKLYKFLLYHVIDFVYLSDYVSKLEWIKTLVSDPNANVIDQKLELEDIKMVMVNYNFDLGFNIDRDALYYLIDGYDDFKAHYLNEIEYNVTIELPYVSKQENVKGRKKKKNPRLTFLVYESGLVTLSGPGGIVMKEGYEKFNRTIKAFEKEIRIDGPREIKIMSQAQIIENPQGL